MASHHSEMQITRSAGNSQTIGDLEYFDHIKKINDVFYDQIKLSDQKAAYIFTFMMALLVTSKDVKAAFTAAHYIDSDVVTIIASACLAISSTLTMLFAVFAVAPRHVPKSTSLFWGNWTSQREDFRRAAQERNVGYLFEQYLANADVLSTIARTKFRFVKFAFLGMMATVLSYVFALIIF
ncbi:Pycsar system effector family protein [Rhizobium sp. TRM95796]|uniref:Pycsar system effector family protein n=1 Tax=Rhizobium sp. TRM95796 TaxID=2979862 RepID=UPI0029880134|nr:Pycsar system effector family protein [Rhizobium sp. TRM95796]